MPLTETITHSPEETEAFAASLAPFLREGDVLFLTGTLGAGKTAFVRGLAQGFGNSGMVSSPTYTLMHQYPTQPIINHFDLYRLTDVDDLYSAGLHEFFGQGVCVVEWPDLAEALCENPIRIQIEPLEPTARRIRIRNLPKREALQ